MERHLLMSHKELERKRVMEHVLEGRITLKQASDLLQVSYRQAVRIGKRFKKQGAKGLVHRSRGRPSNRRRPEALRRKVLKRYEDRYRQFELGPTLLAEKLAEENLEVDHETLRRWLIQEGHWKKKRRRSQHRSRRERKKHFGELVQMDGSHHVWFGEDRPRTCLMELVDDATGTVLALMDEQETTELAMRSLWRWIELYGVPQALYTDKKSVFVTEREPTLEEQLASEQPLTEFGKACKRLGIAIIEANSPQAKGRVERKHAVLQDRFVAELALNGIKTIETANKALQNGFVSALNDKFAQAPLEPQDFHRPVPKGVELADIFCFETPRTLANDWTIRHENRYYQIGKENRPLPRPKDKILVRRRLDGELLLLYRGKPLEFRSMTPRQFERHLKSSKVPVAAKSAKVATTRGTPWRQSCTLMFADSGKED
jgi:transposase